MIKKFKGKIVAIAAPVAGFLVATPAANAQTAPTSLDGFATTAGGYIDTGTDIAIAAGVLSLGWVAFRIVKKYTSKA